MPMPHVGAVPSRSDTTFPVGCLQRGRKSMGWAEGHQGGV